MTFELRALRICYADIDKEYFNMGTSHTNIVHTPSTSFDDIYNGTKFQLLNCTYDLSVADLTVQDIQTILDFLEDNRGFIEKSIRKLRGDKNGI